MNATYCASAFISTGSQLAYIPSDRCAGLRPSFALEYNLFTSSSGQEDEIC